MRLERCVVVIGLGVGVGFAKVCVSCCGVASQQYGADLVAPEHVDDLLVGEDGVGRGALAIDDEEQQDREPQHLAPGKACRT